MKPSTLPPNGGGEAVSNPDTNFHVVNEEISLEKFSDDQLMAFMANRAKGQSGFWQGGKGSQPQVTKGYIVNHPNNTADVTARVQAMETWKQTLAQQALVDANPGKVPLGTECNPRDYPNDRDSHELCLRAYEAERQMLVDEPYPRKWVGLTNKIKCIPHLDFDESQVQFAFGKSTRSMSNHQMTTGAPVSEAAQSAAALPSIEALLSRLGDAHQAALTQAQVLHKVAGDWQASAVMSPGCMIPENEANPILAEATTPMTPMQVALHANVQDPNHHVNLECAIAVFACRCAGKARSDMGDNVNWQAQQSMAGTDLAGVAAKHIGGITGSMQMSDLIDASVQKLLYSGGDAATSRLNLH